MPDHKGQHLYRITYRDGEVGPYTLSLWAYNEEHAQLRFEEGPDADGWEIVKIERKKARRKT